MACHLLIVRQSLRKYQATNIQEKPGWKHAWSTPIKKLQLSLIYTCRSNRTGLENVEFISHRHNAKKKKKVHKTQTILDYPDVLFEYTYPTLTVPVKSKNINSCIGTNERITFPQVSLSGALHRHCYLMDGFLIEAEFQKSIPFWQRNHYMLKLLFILQILLQVTFCKMTGTPYRRRWMLSM